MTESPPYPLLEPWGIITRCKHLRIVIAFQHKRIATIQGRFDMRGRATGIREHAQASPPVTEYELRRFLRVVRDRIRLDLDVFDHETLITAYDVDPRQQLERSLDVAPCAVSQPYGDPQPARQSGNSANVITMLVCNHDCINGFRFKAQPLQANENFLQGKATVEQQSRIARLNHKAVTLRTAP